MTKRLIGALLLTTTAAACQSETPGPASKLTLTWAPSDAAEEYVIERAEAGTGSFREIARVPAAQREYVDRTVRPGARYCYQVRAKNRQGVSPPSLPQCGTPKPG